MAATKHRTHFNRITKAKTAPSAQPSQLARQQHQAEVLGAMTIRRGMLVTGSIDQRSEIQNGKLDDINRHGIMLEDNVGKIHFCSWSDGVEFTPPADDVVIRGRVVDKSSEAALLIGLPMLVDHGANNDDPAGLTSKQTIADIIDGSVVRYTEPGHPKSSFFAGAEHCRIAISDVLALLGQPPQDIGGVMTSQPVVPASNAATEAPNPDVALKQIKAICRDVQGLVDRMDSWSRTYKPHYRADFDEVRTTLDNARFCLEALIVRTVVHGDPLIGLSTSVV